MEILNYLSAAETVMGYDAITELCKYKDKKIGFVVDEGISNLSCFKRVCEELLKGCQFQVIGYVGKEPSMALIDPLIPRIREYNPDLIVALGGGATMDTAKVLRVFCEKSECDWEYIAKETIEGLPGKTELIAVPTTSGTGSECTACAIITDYEAKKTVIISKEICASKIILDFKLLETQPGKVIAYSGLDVIAHAMGALTCKPLSPLAKNNGVQVAVTALKNLEKSYKGDLKAREQMHISAFKAGEAIKNASCGLDHNLDRFAKELNLPHGLVSGILLLYTTKYLIPHENYTDLAEQLGFLEGSDQEKQEQMLEYMFRLYKNLEVPVCLKDFGVKEEDYIPNIERYIEEDKIVGTMYQVTDPSDEDLRQLYREFYYGLEGK